MVAVPSLAFGTGAVSRTRRKDRIDSGGRNLERRGLVEVSQNRPGPEFPESNRTRRAQIPGAGAYGMPPLEQELSDFSQPAGGAGNENVHELTSRPTAPISS